MYVLAMFDLPTGTREQRRSYSRFRGRLLRDGFQQMQYSVYSRHCLSQESAQAHVARIARRLPPEGEVRVVTLTDSQFLRMQVFCGEERQKLKPPPSQLMFF